MVSQLSSRLLSGYSTQSSSSSGGGSNKGISNQSGYSADKEQHNTLPPVHIDLNIKRKSTDGEVKTKRRKLNEMAFAAAMVKTDLARAGFSPQPLRLTSMLAMDSSKVQIISASSVASSPFLTPSWTARNDIVTDFGAAYAAAVKVSKFAYTTSPWNNGHVSPRDESELSTSSVSDTDSDDSQGSSPIIVINARLDDSVEEKPKAPYSTHFITCTPSASMSMEEAVGVCDSSR